MYVRFAYLIIALLVSALTATAQTDTVVAEATAIDSTTVLLEQLENARVTEETLRQEIDRLRVAVSSSDSVRRERLKIHIDSVRAATPATPVVVEDDTLFSIYARQGGLTPEQRADKAAKAIVRLGNSFTTVPDSVYIVKADIVTDIMYGQDVIISLTELDALWADTQRDSLATSTRRVIVDELYTLEREHGLWQLVRRIAYFLLVIVVMGLVFMYVNRGHRRLISKIALIKRTRLHPIYIQKVKLISTEKQVTLLIWLAKALRILVVLVILALAMPLLFSIFPETKMVTTTIISYIWTPVYEILRDIVLYLPNLFTIFVICFTVRWIVKILRYISEEISNEHLNFTGFYPDWALPTFYIIRFLLYAFMVAMIYPYLPGSNSGIFQGISVFVGVIVSLGSSTVIGNILAGLVITYMRPFKVGDRIELKDITGDVIEKTPLVTRIRTPKNEVVTVPNSFIMSSQIVNFSQSAQQFGLIIHTDVTTSYNVPWQKMYDLLINAALNTPGVVDSPRPFVLQTQLGENYPVYQINAYIKDAKLLPDIYSHLNQSIRERFKAEGIDILAPKIFITRSEEEQPDQPK